MTKKTKKPPKNLTKTNKNNKTKKNTTDDRVENFIPSATRCVGYNKISSNWAITVT